MSKIKRVFTLCLIFLLSINSFAAIVSDNDGSAFVTKAEFDALKTDFNEQIDNYNTSIDGKIDGAIASYLAGIKLQEYDTKDIIFNDAKRAIAVNSASQLKFEPKKISINVTDWEDDGITHGRQAKGSNHQWDIIYFRYHYDSPEYEKRWLIEDYGITAGLKYKWVGINERVATSLAIITNKCKHRFAAANAAEGRVYNHYPSLKMTSLNEVEYHLTHDDFVKKDLMESVQTYYKRPDDGTVMNNYTETTPSWTDNVLNISYTDANGVNLTENDYLICHQDISFITGNIDHPEWLHQDKSSLKLSDVIGTLTYDFRGKMEGNVWGFSMRAITSHPIPTVRNNKPGSTAAADTKYSPSFGVCRASASEIKLGDNRSLQLKKGGSYELNDNTLVDGFPLLCEKKGNQIVYAINMEDKTTNYNVWVKLGPFAGEPMEDQCIKVNNNGTEAKTSVIKNGIGLLRWTMPESGIVFIKWEKQDNVTNDIGVLDLSSSNTYDCKESDD